MKQRFEDYRIEVRRIYCDGPRNTIDNIIFSHVTPSVNIAIQTVETNFLTTASKS